MGYRVTIRGLSVHCETEADLDRLIRKYGESTQSRTTSDTPKPRGNGSAPRSGDSMHKAVETLRFISEAGLRGTSASEMAERFHMKSAKGTGSAMALVQKRLHQIGIPVRQVYDSQKRSDGRWWFPRSRINEAITTLEGGPLIQSQIVEQHEEETRL